jgi:hypothetical protein
MYKLLMKEAWSRVLDETKATDASLARAVMHDIGATFASPVLAFDTAYESVVRWADADDWNGVDGLRWKAELSTEACRELLLTKSHPPGHVVYLVTKKQLAVDATLKTRLLKEAIRLDDRQFVWMATENGCPTTPDWTLINTILTSSLTPVEMAKAVGLLHSDLAKIVCDALATSVTTAQSRLLRNQPRIQHTNKGVWFDAFEAHMKLQTQLAGYGRNAGCRTYRSLVAFICVDGHEAILYDVMRCQIETLSLLATDDGALAAMFPSERGWKTLSFSPKKPSLTLVDTNSRIVRVESCAEPPLLPSLLGRIGPLPSTYVPRADAVRVAHVLKRADIDRASCCAVVRAIKCCVVVGLLDFRQLQHITDQLYQCTTNYAEDDKLVLQYDKLSLHRRAQCADEKVILVARSLAGRGHSITGVFLPDGMTCDGIVDCLDIMFPSNKTQLGVLHLGDFDDKAGRISRLRRWLREAGGDVQVSVDARVSVDVLDSVQPSDVLLRKKGWLNDVATIVDPPLPASAFQPPTTSIVTTNKSVLQSDFEESSMPKPIDKQWPVAGISNLLGDGAGARIAVLDTGVDPFHVDMRSIDLEVHSFVKTPSYYDWTSHGTMRC